MKTLTTIILILSFYFVSAQYVCLDWTKAQVKHQFRELPVIYESKNYIEYKTATGWQSYEFTRIEKSWICTQSQICLPQSEADSLISKHRYNWQQIEPNRWLYHTGSYDKPVNVEADRYGAGVVFRYWF